MEILIDWLTFSDRSPDVDNWIRILGLEGLSFEEKEWHKFGYSQAKFAQGISIYWDETIGCVFELSGSGCRALETQNNLSFDWVALFRLLRRTKGVHISRVDVAGDDQEERILNFKKLRTHTVQRKFISRSRQYRIVETHESKEGKPLEQSIYFGSTQSDTRLRIYNKALERGYDDRHWIRVEMQLRNDNAIALADHISDGGSVPAAYAGLLINFLRFTVKRPDGNRNNDRIDTCDWWLRWTDGAQALQAVTVGGLEYNLSALEQTFRKNCLSTVKTWLLLHDNDLQLLQELVDAAAVNDRQKLLLERMAAIETHAAIDDAGRFYDPEKALQLLRAEKDEINYEIAEKEGKQFWS